MPEFPCPGPVELSLRLGAGTATVHAEERSTAVVEVEPMDSSEASREAAAATKVELRGDRLVVEAPDVGGWLPRKSASLRVDVRLPVDSRVVAKLASAELTCEGRLTQFRANSASGDIRAELIGGDANVNTASGDVQLGPVGGQANVNTASGDIDLASAVNDVHANSASGDVSIGAADASVRANTASGEIRIGVANRGVVNVKSASGDVSVGVAAGVRTWLDLSTMSGATTSDLQFEGDVPSGANAADLEIRVRTMSGDITLRKITAPVT